MKKRIFLPVMILYAFVVILPNAFALTISTSGSGDLFSDTYSYLFVIDDKDDGPTAANGTYKGTLTNTSDISLSGALIDLFAFDLVDPDPILGTDFIINQISPDWTFLQTTKGGIKFDYTGARDDPSDRLGPGDMLMFDMTFLDQTYYNSGFGIFTGAETAKGSGIGGDDIGQVAVSFQQLGATGNDSDLVASSGYSDPVNPVPEPATMLLLGTGMLGLIGFSRKKFSKK